jgi:hypothetical protein
MAMGSPSHIATRTVSLSGAANPLRQNGAERKIYNCRDHARPFTLLGHRDGAARKIDCARRKASNG